MRVLVSGSHGLIGTALVAALEGDGDEVVRLVRGPTGAALAGPGEVTWQPETGQLDVESVAKFDGVVHLAGAPIGEKRWTPERKRRILDSRVVTTDLLARRLAETDPRPSVLVSGSAVGYYGDRGDELLDESSPPGAGFLAEVCRQWEQATAPAAGAGIRVVHARTGIVLSPAGGALKKLLPLFRFGVGGRFGSGRQYQSWISLDHEVGAIIHALHSPALTGAVNLTAPNPVTNAEFASTLGGVLRRPAAVPVPAFGLAAVLGRQLVDEMLVAGQRVEPKKLLDDGYPFRHAELEPALRAVLGRAA